MIAPRYIEKGDKVVVRLSYGALYSAKVMRAHRDGSWTVRVQFPLKADGATEEHWGFLNLKLRLIREDIVNVWRRA